MADPAWPMYMPNYLSMPQAQQSSTQAECEKLAMHRQDLEARELEVERRTRALNLNAVRGAETKSAAPSARSSKTHICHKQAPVMPKRAISQVTSQRSLPLEQGLTSGIKVTSTVIAKTVKPFLPVLRTEQDRI